MAGPRAILYVRAPTAGIKGSVGSSVQRTVLMQAASEHGWAVVALYEDVGSGTARPGLDALTKALSRGKADVIVVWSLDRLARSLPHLIGLLGLCHRKVVDVVALDGSVDTRTPTGRALFAAVEALGRAESALALERISVGLTTAKSRGTRSGRAVGRPLRGGTAAEVVRVVEQHGSMRAAARALGVSVSTVSRRLDEARVGGPPTESVQGSPS